MENVLVILNFHGLGKPTRIIPAEEEPFWVDVPFFEAVLDLVQGREDVQVTFDDSNASDEEIALPALKSRNLSARVFVLPRHIGQRGYLCVRRLQNLVSEGIAIGNHGLRHRPWTELNGRDLQEELVEARDRLQQLVSRPVSEAACPFGNYDRRVLRAVRNCGYDRLYTSDDCPAVASCWIQSRYTLLRSHSLAQVQRILNAPPSRLDRAWTRIKLGLKQIR
jgi:peptidoglycan/xylan/chitin deacetylase (PgdA/CDA1 family)